MPKLSWPLKKHSPHAARLFDPAKGDFTAYAARAMRNTLRDLYERQSATTPEARIQQVPARDLPLDDQAAALESAKRLEQAMITLSPRLRLVAEGIRDGKSYSQIGSTLGISKQAAHKLAGAAITTLREKLEAMGFQGLDTLDLLKSGCGVSPNTVILAIKSHTTRQYLRCLNKWRLEV